MNSSLPIRVGIIGLGAIGEGMTQVFTEHQSTEVVAVCDVVEERARQRATDLGNIFWTTNYQELVNHPELDLVYVAVPPVLHYPIVMDLLKTKKHILCEKPLANSLSEAKEMLEKAEEAGIVHAIHFPLSYINNMKELTARMESGYLGKLRRIELEMRFPEWPRKWQKNDWIASREQGGFVFEVAGHFVQIIQQLFGKITPIETELEYPEDPTSCEIGILAKLKLEDGTPILINGISQIPGLQEQSISLTMYGTKGTLSLVDLVKLYGGQLGQEFAEITIEKDMSFWEEFINQLVNAIEGKPSSMIDFHQGYEVQLILEALRTPRN
ncbi:gfo/Idh/MocA family oxidoreductase [Anaerobacillus alkaliphilus]|uniref:Gfo/Idh/MocA family oxidoreductase n=1 Tax=Anaerobacillus alkaliphilus TaxID=1548597 RepID=A0A4Q0VSR8_9BACI|nr:Gfo/Idh/MocA family oxidoreductase [Anaerobacillus alkaliphilus]RXI99814.1 gfo/Idh/MocA family oxidoreductase [Anaerobacillus alkaliphilus]